MLHPFQLLKNVSFGKDLQLSVQNLKKPNQENKREILGSIKACKQMSTKNEFCFLLLLPTKTFNKTHSILYCECFASSKISVHDWKTVLGIFSTQHKNVTFMPLLDVGGKYRIFFFCFSHSNDFLFFWGAEKPDLPLPCPHREMAFLLAIYPITDLQHCKVDHTIQPKSIFQPLEQIQSFQMAADGYNCNSIALI